MPGMNQMIYSAEVRKAMKNGDAIVALESTIISHGMPFPQNLEVAAEVEETVRQLGAVPATIAILNGKVHIGLEAAELEFFASRSNVMKCSRRDLPYTISRGLDGATTVAATMIFAHAAGIQVFATGGIGGVHRNAESTFDISADLLEFARTDVAVVSAGAKAILDLSKTLECLETNGVPVIGFQTDDFPAFYSQLSGLKVPIRLDTFEEIANFLITKRSLGFLGGTLIANPIPAEFEIPREVIEPSILTAIADADRAGIYGKELTPFLLKRLNEVTSGASQVANRKLILNNAVVAAGIAFQFAKMRNMMLSASGA